MERVTHHGRKTAYRRSDRGGDGPGLLCIHGSGGAAGVWKSQSRLADKTPIVALELSGHGESDDVAARGGHDALEAYTEDVVAVAEETDSRVLLGNSLGGAVAMWTALEYDVDIDGLVLTGTGAKLAVLEDLLIWLSNDFDRAVEFLHADDRLFHEPTEQYLEFSKRTTREAGQTVTERDFRTCHTFDGRDRLDEIELPTLAIVGEYDQLTPPSYHEYLADNMPNCEVVVVDDAAHLAMLERPKAFNTAVRTYLDRL